MLKIYNSLNRKVDDFVPIDKNNVRLYTCGITVYDRAHIGNAKTYITADILYRVLKALYKNVKYVRNITDVDDKINKRAVEKGITIQQLTTETTDLMHRDFSYLQLLNPDVEPKVTEHMSQILETIQKLIANGNAYFKDGHVLFDTATFKDYGKLSGRSMDDMIAGARVEVAPYKKNPMDFVLWKPSHDTDDKSAKFTSPWGVGRPGWHIECSAMSHAHLGDNFDIHCGGDDLKFPHHENEIAQSRCAFNCDFVKYWVHVGFLLVNGEKMSKSLNNFYTIQDIQNKGGKGVALKYAFLKNHYRTPFNFTMNLVEEAEKNLMEFHKIIKDVESDKNINDKILEFLCDDLNTPKVLAELHNLKKFPSALKKALEFLGLYSEVYYENKKSLLEESEIQQKINERMEAKKNKNYKKADEIRQYLESNGIVLKDSSGGTSWEVR